jgi:hypothetical protein
MNGAASGSSPVAGFDVRGTEHSGSATTVTVFSYIVVHKTSVFSSLCLIDKLELSYELISISNE